MIISSFLFMIDQDIPDIIASNLEKMYILFLNIYNNLFFIFV